MTIYTVIAELFSVIINYHIYTSVYYLVYWKDKTSGNIYVYSEIVLNGLAFKFSATLWAINFIAL